MDAMVRNSWNESTSGPLTFSVCKYSVRFLFRSSLQASSFLEYPEPVSWEFLMIHQHNVAHANLCYAMNVK